MSQAQDGHTVKIHYTGTLTDGTQFDSSVGRDPLEFQLGASQVIPGLEKAIVGMAVGDKDTITIAADEAYGPHDPDQVHELPRSAVLPEAELEVGMQLQATTEDGPSIPLKVVEVSDETIKIDANHPLAGQELIFEVEIVEISD